MNITHAQECGHSHAFSIKNEKGEKSTYLVLILTALTMGFEVIAGYMYGSMALLADGWHMGTHVAAFLITVYAYRYARKHEKNSKYSFGTGKVGVLGGFASAVALAAVALMMLIESALRLFGPHLIQFNSAILVAVIGLIVNVVCALLLKDDHTHEEHHDHNLQAAYMHVMADSLTSFLAIIALLCGKYLHIYFLDAVMGMVGAVIIMRWVMALLKQTCPILLDASVDDEYRLQIKQAIEKESSDFISDLHIWKISEHHYAAVISVVAGAPKTVQHYKQLLKEFKRLSHITIEVNQRAVN